MHWNPRSSPAPRGALTARPGTPASQKSSPCLHPRPSHPSLSPFPGTVTYPSQPGAREEVPQRGAVRPLGEEGPGLAEEVGSADLHISPFPHWDPSTPRAPALLPPPPISPPVGAGLSIWEAPLRVSARPAPKLSAIGAGTERAPGGGGTGTRSLSTRCPLPAVHSAAAMSWAMVLGLLAALLLLVLLLRYRRTR